MAPDCFPVRRCSLPPCKAVDAALQPEASRPLLREPGADGSTWYSPLDYIEQPAAMAHTSRQKDKLIARVRRIKGQLEGIERALDSEAACVEVLRQIASVRGAVNGLTAEVMEDHLREHVLAVESDRERNRGGEEMIEVIRAYMK